MKKLHVVLILSLLTVFGCGTALAASPIVEKLTEHIKSDNAELSLGAMLISVDVNDRDGLDRLVRGSLNKKDAPWVTAIKTYTLSRYTLDDDDALRFVSSVPSDKANFDRLIDFECGVTRHPGSKILEHLLHVARTSNDWNIRKAAVDKLDSLQTVADGWVGDSIRPRY